MIVTTNGSAVEVQYTATVNGAPTDPTTITVAFRLSGGAWTTPAAMVRDALGSYHYDYEPPAPGYYAVRVATTGPDRTETGGIAVLGTDAPPSGTAGTTGPTPLAAGRILFTDAAGALATSANYTIDPTTGALTLKDTSGTEQFTASKYLTQSVGLFRGSAGSPVTTAGPIVKVTKNENLNSAAMGGNPADSAVNANVVSIVTGALTNYPQSTAYYGLAQGGGTTAGSDAVGLIGIGIIANVGSTSWGMGAYFEGRSAVSGGRWYGAELSPNNQTGVDATTLVNNACNPGTGAWVPARGPNLSAVGVQVGAVNGSPGYRVGFMVNAASATEASFREDSSAVLGMDIRGTHTYGIDLHLATLSAAGIMLPNNKSVAAKSTTNADIALISLDGANRTSLPNGLAINNNTAIQAIDTGATGRTLMMLDNVNVLTIGTPNMTALGGSAGTVIFQSNAIESFRLNLAGGTKFSTAGVGFYGTNPVTTKPTVTGAKGSNAALASLLTALAAYGLVTDSTTA